MMSITMIDYLPFDYNTYIYQIVPAIQQATEGDEVPLRTLLESVNRFSSGPRSMVPVPLSQEEGEYLILGYPSSGSPYPGQVLLEGLMDVATLRRIKAGVPLHPWHHLANVIPSLKGRRMNALGRFGEMLHLFLFYTLCTEPPAASWTHGKPVLPHDEPVFDWRGYTSRDEETRTLWGMFHQAAPEDFPYPITGEEARALFTEMPIPFREQIIGFLTPEEAQSFLEQVHVHERPEIESILSSCIRDGVTREWALDPDLPLHGPGKSLIQDNDTSKAWGMRLIDWMYQYYPEQDEDFRTVFAYWLKTHPEEMTQFQERYYKDIWEVEAEILQRMSQAVARGWGMIQTFYQ